MKTIDEMKRETTVPVVLADQRGRITYVNERFQEVFGWGSQEILGRSLTAIIPPNLHDAHHLGFSRFLTGGEPTLLGRALLLKAVGKRGEEFDAEHTIIAERREGQWVFGATIRPI